MSRWLNVLHSTLTRFLITISAALVLFYVYVSTSLPIYGEDLIATGRGLELRPLTSVGEKLYTLVRPWLGSYMPFEWRPALVNIVDTHYFLFGGEMWVLFLFRWAAFGLATYLGLRILKNLGANRFTQLFFGVSMILCPLPVIQISTASEVFLLVPIAVFLYWIGSLSQVKRPFANAPMSGPQMLVYFATFMVLTGLKETAIPIAFGLLLTTLLLHRPNRWFWVLVSLGSAWFLFCGLTIFTRGPSAERGVELWNAGVWFERMYRSLALLFPRKSLGPVEVALTLFSLLIAGRSIRDWIRRKEFFDFRVYVFVVFIVALVIAAVPMSKYAMADRYLVPAYFVYYLLIALFLVGFQSRRGFRWLPLLWGFYFIALTLNRTTGQYLSFVRMGAEETEIVRRLTDLKNEGCSFTMSGRTTEQEGEWGQTNMLLRVLGTDGQRFYSLRNGADRLVTSVQSDPSDKFVDATHRCLALVTAYSPLTKNFNAVAPAGFALDHTEVFDVGNQGAIQALMSWGAAVNQLVGNRFNINDRPASRLYLNVFKRTGTITSPAVTLNSPVRGRVSLTALGDYRGPRLYQVRMSTSGTPSKTSIQFLGAQNDELPLVELEKDEHSITFVPWPGMETIEVLDHGLPDFKLTVMPIQIKASTRRYGALIR